MEARGNFGLENQQDTIGLHQNARDAEDKTDAKGWLSQAAVPILGLANEEKGTGEAAQQRKQKKIGKFSVCGFDNGCVAKSGKDTQDK